MKLKTAIKETNEEFLNVLIQFFIIFTLCILVVIFIAVPLFSIFYLAFYNSGWYATLLIPYVYFMVFLYNLI